VSYQAAFARPDLLQLPRLKDFRHAEFIPQPGQRDGGHLPNMDGITLDLYRLIAIYPSSKALTKTWTERAHPVAYLRQYEEDEITRIMLNTAISARIIAVSLHSCDVSCHLAPSAAL